MLKLHVIREGETENKVLLKPNMVVEYCCHLPGGMVAIKVDGKDDVAHQACFKELN